MGQISKLQEYFIPVVHPQGRMQKGLRPSPTRFAKLVSMFGYWGIQRTLLETLDVVSFGEALWRI